MVPLLAILALSAPAAPKKAGTVALVMTEEGVPPAWRAALQKAAQSVDLKGDWVAPPAVTLEEAQLALGCAGWNNACAAQIAGMTGATQAAVVAVGPSTITVEMVKANGSSTKPVTAELYDLSDDGLRWAEDVVKASLKGALPALFVLQTTLPAEVHVDGTKMGQTAPPAPLLLRLTAGEHRVSVIGPGAPQALQLNVRPGVVVRESVALSEPPPELPPKVEVPTPTTKLIEVPEDRPPEVATPPDATVGWSIAGTGAAIAVAATIVNVAAVYDLYYNRVPCGGNAAADCGPLFLMFGIVSGPARKDFYLKDGVVWVSASASVIGAGALIAGTGLLVAMSTSGAE